MRFPFGLRYMVEDAHHLIVAPFGSSPTDGEFKGMTDYVLENFHNLLTGESEAISDSGSIGGSHHPSRGCFMAGIPEGRVLMIGPMRGTLPPPPARLEQLRERQKGLEQAHLQIEQECAELGRGIGRRGEGWCMRRRL
jgi:hypothetical protein